jgi:hypothetical protein
MFVDNLYIFCSLYDRVDSKIPLAALGLWQLQQVNDIAKLTMTQRD